MPDRFLIAFLAELVNRIEILDFYGFSSAQSLTYLPSYIILNAYNQRKFSQNLINIILFL